MSNRSINKYAITETLSVVEWYRNGDHPDDRTVNRLNSGKVVKPITIDNLEHVDKICPLCNCRADKHGILQNAIDNEIYVCPGDYIESIKERGRTYYRVHKRGIFDRYYNNNPPVEVIAE